MVRLNVVVQVEYVETVMGDWIRHEVHGHRTPDEYKRHIFESKIAPILKGTGIQPLLFWIQCLPDSSFRPERPPMFEGIGRKPLRPEQRALYGYDPSPNAKDWVG
jgi:hypothetical protein